MDTNESESEIQIMDTSAESNQDQDTSIEQTDSDLKRTVNGDAKTNETGPTSNGAIKKCPMAMGNNHSEWNALDHYSVSSKDGSIISDSDGDNYGGMDDLSDVSVEEIDAMLEEGLPDEFKKRKLKKIRSTDDVTTTGDANNKTNDSQSYEEKEKIVIIEKGHNHFDVLPEGWLQVTHNSGMPLYLHKTSRVCTLSKPYFLGSGSARKHKIPLSAVPCLNYKRAMEKEEEMRQQKEQEEANAAQNPSANATNELWLPNARIETVQENLQVQSLDAEEFREYCKKIFKFKTIKVMRFKSWPARRKFTKSRHERQLNRPTLPDGTKLITFPIQNADNDHPSNSKKEWIMNPNGKSYVCILHEYVQHALKKQPSYEFKELENAAMPYSATVSINDMKYGVGYGTSKKQAKSDAAKATLEILIPQMRSKITAESEEGASTAGRVTDHDLSFFDDIKIEDPRVAEFCAKTTEPSPHAILLICLQRNFGLTDLRIEYHGNTLKHQKNEFTMTVGKHKATVICKNKRDGKQRASQAILQALHPHITSWGSLLRLYGNRSVKSFREKKQEEQEITQLQSKAAVNSPNYAILDKLRIEMTKLKDKKELQKNKGGTSAGTSALGRFIPDSDDGSSSNHMTTSLLNNVDL
ncbi:microprocessor complex subunit DGCR8 [Chrysoperla carnea]|uniref:microprocessor complex subunit DGCR8 n=1 Tax=Chrysoperla carnea TaxID=189513 RepID=UPI001D05F65B|nr:microprocessor complex subunit DGCR8 [Chrysoperla carnea]XP_044741581.1 microprocessor complex subunit DGCR8 [Chrysoperla carnea]